MNPWDKIQPKRVNGVGVAKKRNEKTTDNEIRHEKNEMSFIVQTDTLVYPRTMVIILENAFVANAAMMGPLAA